MYIERSRDKIFIIFAVLRCRTAVHAAIEASANIAACGSYYVIRGCYGTTERFKDGRKS